MASAASAAAPTFTVDPSPTATYTSAQVKGTIDPVDQDFLYYSFEYTTDPNLGWSGFAYEGTLEGPKDVSAELHGLQPGTEYQVRLAAFDGGSEYWYSDPPYATFTTFAAPTNPPVVATDLASSISYTSAHISGTVDPEGGNLEPGGGALPISWQLQYSSDPVNNSWIEAGSGEISGAEAEGTSPITVQADLTSLSPHTTYAFRLIATYGGVEATSPEPHRSFETLEVAKPAVAIDPVTTFTGATAHFSGSINPNAPEAAPTSPAVEAGFKVNWHFECTPSCPGLSGDTISADSSNHPVEADASGLEPNTSYEVTLIAENAGGQTSDGPEAFKTSKVAPMVQTLGAGAIGTNTAGLSGRVNPRNSAVTYQFEWGPDDSYGNLAPSSPQVLGSEDNAFHVVTAPLGGLLAGVTYHFRIVATNTETSEVSKGPDRPFTTLAESPDQDTGLPDHRVYERVSPIDKNGNDVGKGTIIQFSPLSSQTRVSRSGQAVIFASGGNVGGDGGTPYLQYIARRGSDGWSSTGISPRMDPGTALGNNSPYWAFSDDLSEGLLTTQAALNPGDPIGRTNLYLRDLLSLKYTLIASPPSATLLVRDGGLSTDASHIVFADVSSNPQAFLQTYEWVDGTVRAVGILPDGAPVEATPGNGGLRLDAPGEHLLSADGSRIYFTLARGGETLYVREGGTATALVGKAARFELARASNGAVAFFSSRVPQVAGATPGVNLYRWDATAPAASRLTDVTTTDPSGADVLGTVLASDDATSVYFVAKGKLTADAVRGTPNLYLWREGEGVRLVATLSNAVSSAESGEFLLDIGLWYDILEGAYGQAERGQTAKRDPYREARITSDGRFLTFASRAQLTSYDTNGTKQLYLYDAKSEQTTCISCSTFEPHSMANSSLYSVSVEDACCDAGLALTRNISGDGRRVFFDSHDALVPRDTNGKTDVYEWSDGQLHLLSSGSSGAASRFIGASESGDDAFFVTSEPLVRSDQDDFFDIYDARVGGRQEPAPIPGCSGDACQGTPSAPPVFETPGTSSNAGPGNPRTAAGRKCRRGRHLVKVRGKKRCTKARGNSRTGRNK